MKHWSLLIVAAFLALAALLAFGLSQDPSRVPSPLVGKPVPAFEVEWLYQPQRTMTAEQLEKPAIVNVWASWCAACVEEHPLLLELAKTELATLYGINYKDLRPDAKAWLKQYEDPYKVSVHDYDGRVGIEFGVYAVPETFVIDHEGIIRYKQIGPLDRQTMDEVVLPLLEQIHKEQKLASKDASS